MGNGPISRIAWPHLNELDPTSLRRAATHSRTLVVDPATAVWQVRQQLLPEHDLILVSSADGHVSGLVTKPWLEDSLRGHGLPLGDLLERADHEGDRFLPLRQVPRLRLCVDGNHYIVACPCEEHRGSPCK
jgi:hypothetical protein